jgi:hypothetical protein
MFPVDNFMLWWLRSGRYSWSRFRRKAFERRYLNNDLPVISSLDDLEHCLKKVTWTMDGPLHLFDCISHPQVTWEKKKDDCDGFATLAAHLLNQLDPDYRPVLVTAIVHPLRYSHTVCAFQSPGNNLWFSDNYTLRKEDCRSYDEVVDKIAKHTKRIVCWDARDPFTFEIIHFHRNF